MTHEEAVRKQYPQLSDREVEIAVSVLQELDWNMDDYKSITIAVNTTTDGEVL
jgi:hypothetical protein